MSNSRGSRGMRKYCEQDAQGQDVQMPEEVSRGWGYTPGSHCFQWAIEFAPGANRLVILHTLGCCA